MSRYWIATHQAVTVPARSIRPAESQGPAFAADELLHVISWWQWAASKLLRRKTPHTICGASLRIDPDRPDPGSLGAQTCPQCAMGCRYRKMRRVSGRWIARGARAEKSDRSVINGTT